VHALPPAKQTDGQSLSPKLLPEDTAQQVFDVSESKQKEAERVLEAAKEEALREAKEAEERAKIAAEQPR
jgi:hypothetical protein